MKYLMNYLLIICAVLADIVFTLGMSDNNMIHFLLGLWTVAAIIALLLEWAYSPTV
jgi:hypothetical protein